MTLRKLNSFEKLDAVLTVLNNAHKSHYTGNTVKLPVGKYRTKAEILRQVPFDYDHGDIEFSDLHLIVEYLMLEKLISHAKEDNKDMYCIRYAGNVLIEEGGFVKKESNKEVVNSRLESIEKRSWRMTLIMAIGTGGLLLLEGIKFMIQRLDMVFCNCQ